MKKTITKVKAAVTGVVILSATALTHPYWSVDDYTVTVNNALTKGEDNLVYTDGGTFTANDTWAYLRFDSSDFYGAIVSGKQYSIKASGHRLGLPFGLSMYPNIISYEEVK